MFQDGTCVAERLATHAIYQTVKPRETQTHVERLMRQCMERAMHTIELVAPIVLSYNNYDYFVSQTLVTLFLILYPMTDYTITRFHASFDSFEQVHAWEREHYD